MLLEEPDELGLLGVRLVRHLLVVFFGAGVEGPSQSRISQTLRSGTDTHVMFEEDAPKLCDLGLCHVVVWEEVVGRSRHC